MSDTILIESQSPNGNLTACVEQDERCVYLYLAAHDDGVAFRMKACWVRNLVAAPAELQSESMKQGLAPLLPAAACAHPNGAPKLSSAALELVWFEEGDAVALVEHGQALAVIPAWGGERGFSGYARDCTEETTLAWPLLRDNALHARIRRAMEHAKSWESGDPWSAVQTGAIDALEAAFGPHTNYYAIDGGRWPPRALLRFRHRDAVVLATCGVQLRPQPRVELATETPEELRRIELAVAIDAPLFEAGGDDLMSWLSGQANYPWSRLTWFGHGHTMACNAVPVGPSGRRFDWMLFNRSPDGAREVRLPKYRGDPVTLLWMQPISTREREVARQAGSTELTALLARKGAQFIHRDRDFAC